MIPAANLEVADVIRHSAPFVRYCGKRISLKSSPSDRRRNAVYVHCCRRVDIEGIGKSYEQIEQRRIVHGLSDLRVGPSHVSKRLHLFIGDAVCVPRHRADKFQQKALSWGHGSAVQIAITQSLCHRAELLSLQLQEPCVAAESIVTSIQRRDIRGNHLVLGPRESAVGKVQARRLHDRGQEIGAVTHRVENVRYTLAADPCNRSGPGRFEELGELPVGVALLDPANSWHEYLLGYSW
jgi:hypothetical protein